MATAVARAVEVPDRTHTPSPPPHLTLNTTYNETPAAIPHKHIPYCSPGPQPNSPPLNILSPTSSSQTATKPQSESPDVHSALYPPDENSKVQDSPPVYSITAKVLVDALHHTASQPLPDPQHVFPWLHGLHRENQLQLSFFNRLTQRRLPDVPTCLRGITIIKAGGNLGFAKLKGAISPEEILLPADSCKHKHSEYCEGGPCFIDIDPLMGFSVRNFHIQACKLATISDLVVYGDDFTPKEEVEMLAQLLARAQQTWKRKIDSTGVKINAFNTFLVTDPFETFEAKYPEVVASSSSGLITGQVLDFLHQERVEMWNLSKPSEIAKNVYLGPTPDPSLFRMPCAQAQDMRIHFDILIETSDFAQMPDESVLEEVEGFLDKQFGAGRRPKVEFDFPSSGSLVTHTGAEWDVERLIATVAWIHKVVNGSTTRTKRNSSGGSVSRSERKILIHCTDGYTENSLLGLAYLMYAEGVPAHEAWLRLHKAKGRNFFSYQADKNLLESIERRIIWESPCRRVNPPIPRAPAWSKRMDGSLPSRILPHLYLGNLTHATNPGLLRELGITNILSVGEPIKWHLNPSAYDEEPAAWPSNHFLYIDGVQDNGVDPLTKQFSRCLDFISKAKSEGRATLVHCRVGVSRSATICIAEVMNEMGLSFPRAYCFVRARRLNVIIQPHLRFAYELLKWEELQNQKRGLPLNREAEWATIAREIALMNKPYCRE